MKVILLKDIARLGKRGDVKDVATGYAMNVLVAKKDAIIATPTELSKWKQKEEAKVYKKELSTSLFLQLIKALREKKIIITDKKHDEKGQLFAQIKESDIVHAIFNLVHISIDEKQVIIPKIIKSVGTHSIELKQGAQKEVLTIEVK
jgi:large subunit ribosomal protein L9